MIPQPFVKGGGERVFFGQFEYVSGADLIYDFGNPLCTSAFNSSQIVYNVGTANVTGSLIPYFNPGAIYPTLSSVQGGVMITNATAFAANYLQWDWKSTEQQTNIAIFALNGAQGNPYSSDMPQAAGANSIVFTLRGITAFGTSSYLDVSLYDSSNTGTIPLISSIQLNNSTGSVNNGYNVAAFSANNSTQHLLYINNQPVISDTTNITRTTSGTQTTKFSIASNVSSVKIMAFLQYPFILTPKQIRQTYKVFSQRFFT
jgi:hypothetical protein